MVLIEPLQYLVVVDQVDQQNAARAAILDTLTTHSWAPLGGQLSDERNRSLLWKLDHLTQPTGRCRSVVKQEEFGSPSYVILQMVHLVMKEC